MSQQKFKRCRGPMRFKPTQGLSTPKSNRAAASARAAALGDQPGEDLTYDRRRHEAEIRRAENLAAGLPEDTQETGEEAPAKERGP